MICMGPLEVIMKKTSWCHILYVSYISDIKLWIKIIDISKCLKYEKIPLPDWTLIQPTTPGLGSEHLTD